MIRNKCDNIFQWDTNLVLDVPASDIVYVDFQSSDVIRVAVEDGSCRIPDEILETAGKKILWLCHDDQTREQFIFNVKARPIPPDHITTPTQRITFDSLVRDVRTSIEEADMALGAMMASVEREVGDKMSSVDAKMDQVDADVSNALESVQEATERAEDASDGAERVNIESSRVSDGIMVTTTDRNGNQTVTTIHDGQGSSYDDTELRDRIGQAEEDLEGVAEHFTEVDAFAEELGEAVQTLNSTKLEKPSSGIAVGKYFRVASIDDAGNPVLEAVDLPIANAATDGVVKIDPFYGLQMSATNKVTPLKASNAEIEARTNQYRPITPYNLRPAVDSVLCSTAAAEALTSDQKYAFWNRVEKPWVFKGSFPANRTFHANLLGCTEFMIVGSITASGSGYLNISEGRTIISGFGNSDSRNLIVYFKHENGLLLPIVGKYSGSSAVSYSGNFTTYARTDVPSLTDDFILALSNSVTEFDLKLYAR